MHLKVEQAIDSIKSSLLASTHTRSFYNKPSTENKKKAWSGIDDGLKIFKLYRRFLRVQFAFTLVLAIFFVNLFAYVSINHNQYQLDILYSNDVPQLVFWSLISTSVALSIVMFILVLTSILRFQSRKQMALARREQPTSFSLLLLELIILLIQPYPFLQEVKVSRVSMSNQELNPLKLNHILVVISLLKLTFFGRGMLNFLTPYGNPRNFRIYKIYGLTNNPLNIVRNLFQQHPVIIISILYIFSMLIFAYSYRILENGASEDQILNYFEGSLWLAVLTMTTVGYGDVKPCTSFGVVITVISSFIGVIGTSLFVLSITTNLEMNYKQQRSLHILRRFRNRKQQKIVSGMFIRICLWRLWQQYKLKKSFKMSNEERRLKRQISEMNQQAKRIFKQSSLFQEVMQQQFQIVRCHITSILENYDQMLQYCSNKEQVIEGVIKNMQSYKHETKKLELVQDQNVEKGVKIWVQMVQKTSQM